MQVHIHVVKSTNTRIELEYPSVPLTFLQQCDELHNTTQICRKLKYVCETSVQVQVCHQLL